MAGFEQLIIVGNLGREPELHYTQQGLAVCSFSVAVNRRYTSGGEQRETTKWYRVSAWRELGERCQQYLEKGSQVMVVGTVAAHAYTTRQGESAASLEVTAQTVQFLGSRRDGAGAGDYDDFAPPPEGDGDIPF